MPFDASVTENYGENWVIGIGASAGGLEALSQFVSHLPKSFAGTVVIAQHLAPHSKSMLVELLARHASRPIVSAQDHVKLKPGTIYVVPPNFDIDLIDGHMELTVAGEETRPKPSVDTFFMSLARAYGPRSVGIILSGTGSDGSEGIRAIKSAGGITLAQDDRSAKYDGMPKSAVDTGSVDSILPPESIAENLLQILEDHEARIRSKGFDAKGLEEVFDLIREKTGSDFRQYKPSTIQRRTAKRMGELGMKSLREYIDLLKATPGEVTELSSELLISVTSFFRDPDVFEALTNRLAGIIEAKASGQEVRVWVAGCATGEEAYSIAMITLDLLDRMKKTLLVKIFATDLDHDAILEARTGIYGGKDVESIPRYFRGKFLEPRDGGRFEMVKRIRDACVFARQDLIQNPPFVKLDMISCRNVMIYFEAPLQARILETFHYALAPSGLLLLGKSEAVGATTGLFETLDRKTKLFEKLNVPSKMHSPTRMIKTTPVEIEPFNRRRQDVGPSLSEIAALKLLKAYGISGAIVDEDANVIQIVGDVSAYLGFHTSQADLRLPNLLPKGVGIEIPILIRKAAKDGETYRSRTHRVGKGPKAIAYTISVRPLYEADGPPAKPLFVVNFEPKKTKEISASAQTLPVESEYPTRLSELEHELYVTREHLQTVIEELGVSNEELQSLNEELSSTNEELQASNEELETTNEELQSSNEELTTVNEELSIKSTELRQVNTALENIQNSIGSPLVVVDEYMRVVRYNAGALKIFTLSSADIGRELNRVSTICELPDFEKLMATAIQKGVPSEGICENASTVYQMRVLPSFDEAKRIIGAVLIFFDNTDLIRTKERLVISEQRVRAIIDSTPALLCLKDTLGRYLLVNESFRNFFNVKEAELAGKTDREVFNEKLATQFRDGDLEVFLRRKSVRQEEKITLPDGKQKTFMVSRFPLMDNTGSSPYAVGTIAFDISGQVEIQDKLKESEMRYRAIAEDQAVFVCRHRPDMTLTYANNIFANYFGSMIEMGEGRKFDAIINDTERSQIQKEIRSISLDRPVIQYEHRVLRFGTEERWVRWIHRGIFDSSGQVIDYQAVGFDVTDYRNATDQLLQKEAIFTGIFNNANDFITIFRVLPNGELVLESLNRTAERSLGFAYAQLIGRRLRDFLNPERADEIVERYLRVLNTMKPDVFDEELQAPGGIKHFSTTVVPIPGPEGKPERVAALSRDVSSYKNIERDLRKAKDVAEIANRAKSDFLASMSHELRTPLNVVLGLSQLLEDTSLDSEQQGYVRSIHRSGRVLLALIEDVLDISKIEAGKIRLETIPFSIQEMVEEVVDLFAAQASEKNLRLSFNISELANKTVIGDPSRLRQVLVNFVGNAIKFTDQGGVDVLVDVESESGGTPMFHFRVLDTGIGIRPEDHGKVFQKFSQVHSGNSRRYGGTGLGLVISRHLVELMNGATGFTSEPGRGSTFWMKVPLPISARLERPARKPLALSDAKSPSLAVVTKGSEGPGAQAVGRKLQVLAIDDNRDSQNVIKLLLKRMGHDPIAASSGAEAIDLLQKHKFDVVLMDVQMPEMDGYEATRRIRAMEGELSKVPIIALTANALSGDAEKCLKAGMDAYLTKPVRIESLREALLKWAAPPTDEPESDRSTEDEHQG